MIDVAARCSYARTEMNGPLPSGLVCCAADGHAPDADQFEFSFFEHSHFVRLLKALQNCLKHRLNSFASRRWQRRASCQFKLDALSQNSSVTAASRGLSTPHSPVQPRDANGVRWPGKFTKSGR